MEKAFSFLPPVTTMKVLVLVQGQAVISGLVHFIQPIAGMRGIYISVQIKLNVPTSYGGMDEASVLFVKAQHQYLFLSHK